jgi:predicted metal-dependent hydrolase
VQWLEDDARTTAQYLIEMDKRTKGEELRKRAPEAPELRKKCDDFEEKNEVLRERLEELEDELDRKGCGEEVREEGAKRVSEEQLQQAKMEDELLRQVELENWRNETLRLNLALNEIQAELGKLKADVGIREAAGAQGSLSDHEMVYRCQWRPEGSNYACEGLFLSVEVCLEIYFHVHNRYNPDFRSCKTTSFLENIYIVDI